MKKIKKTGMTLELERNNKKYDIEINKDGHIIVIFKGAVSEETPSPTNSTN